MDCRYAEFRAVVLNRKIAAFAIYLQVHGADAALCRHFNWRWNVDGSSPH